jgi:hypothetical protein
MTPMVNEPPDIPHCHSRINVLSRLKSQPARNQWYQIVLLTLIHTVYRPGTTAPRYQFYR